MSLTIAIQCLFIIQLQTHFVRQYQHYPGQTTSFLTFLAPRKLNDETESTRKTIAKPIVSPLGSFARTGLRKMHTEYQVHIVVTDSLAK